MDLSQTITQPLPGLDTECLLHAKEALKNTIQNSAGSSTSEQASKLVAKTVAEVAEAAQKERSLEELSKLPEQKSISEVAVLVGTIVLAVILTVAATNPGPHNPSFTLGVERL